MEKTLPEVISRLTDLARKADPAKNPCEHERQASAMVACKLLRHHADALATLQPATPWHEGWSWGRQHEETTTPPPKPSGRSSVHPKAAAQREWAAFKKEHGLFEMDVGVEEDALCLACGDRFQIADTLVGGEHGWTHQHCAGWWWTFEFPPRTWSSSASAPAEDGGGFDDGVEIPY